MNWISSRQLADTAGISERKARLALQRVHSGNASGWRGASITVGTVKGKGGRAGLQYQVRVDSLPIELQQRLEEASKAPSTAVAPRKFETKHHAAFAIFENLAEEVDATKPGTAARANVFRAWSARELVDIKGSGVLRRYSVRQLKRICEALKKDGLVSLGRARRNDSGAKRAILTTKFDRWARGAGMSDSDIATIAETVKQRIRGWHKAWESVSAIRLDASRRLETLAKERGLEPPPGVCDVPMHVVNAERLFRRVGEHKKDRKASQDRAPAIRRTIEGLWPMDIIVGDVHPLDFLLPEVEDFQRYAKAICWYDVATKRLWATVVFLPKGRAIRNADVIASFKAMVSDWGLPKTLYLDNGSEYIFAEFIRDAAELASNGERVLIRAKPYNARAKAIEGVFGSLRHLFAKMPGYIGGDRMKSKVANVGKAPVPFDGSLSRFAEMVGKIVDQYHLKPQRGQLNGRSPIAAYDQAIANGWHKTEVDPSAFAVAFATRERVAIKNGAVKAKDRWWKGDELSRSLTDWVVAVVPKYEEWDALPIEDERGNHLGFLREDGAYGYLDEAGAKESARRQSLRIEAIRKLDKSAPDIDVTAEILDFPAALPAIPAPTGDRVTGSDSARAIAKVLKESPKARREREEAQRRREDQDQRALAAEFAAKHQAMKAKAG